MFTLKTILELLAILILLWGYLHEEEIAEWERRTMKKAKRRATK